MLGFKVKLNFLNFKELSKLVVDSKVFSLKSDLKGKEFCSSIEFSDCAKLLVNDSLLQLIRCFNCDFYSIVILFLVIV